MFVKCYIFYHFLLETDIIIIILKAWEVSQQWNLFNSLLIQHFQTYLTIASILLICFLNTIAVEHFGN